MKITYHYFDSKAQEREARAAMMPAVRVLPFWVNRVEVQRLEGNGDAVSCVRCFPEYRCARITIYPGFYENNPNEQAMLLIHECIHTQVAPFTDWARDTIRMFQEKNPELHESLERQRVYLMEGIIEDFSYVVGGLLGLPDAGDALLQAGQGQPK
jgi:hypothetical protein